MPTVTISMFEGKTIDQKKQLENDVISAFVKNGFPSDKVHVVIEERPKPK